MALTNTDAVNEALAWLRVAEVGETPTTDEFNAANAVLTELQAEWVSRRVSTINLQAINPQDLQPIAKLLGNRIGPKFGRPYDADIDLREEARLRENQSQFTRRRGVGAVGL